MKNLEIEEREIPQFVHLPELYAAMVSVDGLDWEILSLSPRKECCRAACRADAENAGGLVEPDERGLKLAWSADGEAAYAITAAWNPEGGQIELELKQRFSNWL